MCMYVYVFVCICDCVYMGTCRCMYVCMHVCVYVFFSVYTCMHVCVCVVYVVHNLFSSSLEKISSVLLYANTGMNIKEKVGKRMTSNIYISKCW